MSGAAAQQSEIEALAKAVALARQRADAGDLTSARTLLESALAIGELRLGRDHPQLVPLMVDLATIAREVGNLTESQTQLSRAYEIAVLATGPEHPSALKIEARLAVVTGRLGEPTDAYDWHLADAGARVLGPDHVAVRSARERLGARHGMGPGGTPSADEDPDRPMIAPTGPPPSLPPASLPKKPASLPSRSASLPVEPVPADPPAAGDLQPPPTYMPTLAPGVYERRPNAVAIYTTPAPLAEFSGQEIAIWPEPDEPTTRSRPYRPHRAGLAVVAGIGAAVLIASAIVAVKALGPASAGAASGQRTTPPVILTVAPTTPPPTPTPSPTLAAIAPMELALADTGGSVTLTWRDPTGGRVPFLVTGGRVGTGARPLESIPAGRTRSIVYGLNNKFDYCFIVSAVYSATLIAPSIRICTHRLSTGNTT